MSYGAEIWGWKERREIEMVHERYIKWTMGLDRRTPGYMVGEETGREMMRGRAGKRAWRLERKLEERRGGGCEEMLGRIKRDLKERWRKGKILGNWEQERREFLKDREVKEGEEEIVEYEDLEERDKIRQKEEREKRIRESRYNKWHKEIKEEGVEGYLKKG